MSKKRADADRKAKVEQMRQAQQAAERRRTLLVVGAAALVVVVLVGVVVGVIRSYQSDRDVANTGVGAAAASCDDVVRDKVSGGSVHVGPGTDKPDVGRVKYATVPPSSGEHFAVPESPARAFYTAQDRPKMEALVHNLEHGYTIAWYTDKTPKAQLDELRKISDLSRDDKATAGKFLASAWDDAYGAFPAGKTVALSHWGAKTGYRQLCGQVSGEVVKQFIKAHPYSDSPEPNAA